MTPFEEDGYAIINSGLDAASLYAVFQDSYLSKFTHNAERNRNLIKTFANDMSVRSIFTSDCILNFLAAYQNHSVVTGPVVTHYTSLNETGSGHALPFHQDWPSMASSSRSIICWMPLTKVGPDTHGIEVIPRSHREGALPGRQLETGYVVDIDEAARPLALEADVGDLVFMSAWLVHRTRLNMACDKQAFKLALSLRFDDLEDPAWSARDFVTAYGNTVDRELWRQTGPR